MTLERSHKQRNIWRCIMLYAACFFVLLSLGEQLFSVHNVDAAGATTSIHVIKYDKDGSTVLGEKTVSYQWMKENLPVLGDGITHYYHQGPVFEGDMWDPQETVNLKDKGAVKGTDVKDICDLVGGMYPNDEVVISAIDGYYVRFAYTNIYEPQDLQGPITLCWYKGEATNTDEDIGTGYPGNSAYSSAIQIVFMARTTNREGKYVFGNTDMRICLPEEKYQHFYEGLPSTNGLSGKWITEIRIYKGGMPENISIAAEPREESQSNTGIFLALGCTGILLLCAAIVLLIRYRGFKNKKGRANIVTIAVLITGVLLIIIPSCLYTYQIIDRGQDIDWQVSLVGSDGSEIEISYDEIIAMPQYKGRGGFFTTVGVINGPYEMQGVLIEDLCARVGGIEPSNAVLISATDGYSAVFDYEQLRGEFPTYDPETMQEVPHGELKLILAYKQDGKLLSHEGGRPLRLAIVGGDSLLTEGLHWIKWVNRIEILKIE